MKQLLTLILAITSVVCVAQKTQKHKQKGLTSRLYQTSLVTGDTSFASGTFYLSSAGISIDKKDTIHVAMLYSDTTNLNISGVNVYDDRLRWMYGYCVEDAFGIITVFLDDNNKQPISKNYIVWLTRKIN